MILLKIDPLNQHDKGWADKLLGNIPNETLGNYGCLLTCLAMEARYFGFDVTPQDINVWCQANNGFVNGDQYIYSAFPKQFPNTSFDNIERYPLGTPAQTASIDKYLAEGKPVVIEVDFDRNSHNGVQMHFVLIVGKDDQGRYIINDPWTGTQVLLDNTYGKPADAIFQICLFSGTVPVSQTAITSLHVTSTIGLRARTAPTVNTNNIAKIYPVGSVIESIGKVTGDSISGNNEWYQIKDSVGILYVWSGAARFDTSASLTPPTPPAPAATPTVVNVVAPVDQEAINGLLSVYETTRDILIARNALPNQTVSDKTGGFWAKVKGTLNII